MSDEHPAASGSGDASDASVTADAQLPALDDRQVNGLREAHRKWAHVMSDPKGWERALPDVWRRTGTR